MDSVQDMRRVGDVWSRDGAGHDLASEGLEGVVAD